MINYRETLKERGAKNITFVAERDDQAHLAQIADLTGANQTGAIRKALEHYAQFLKGKLK